MSELARDFSEFSLFIRALREDLDCSSSKALSLRAVALERAEAAEGGAREGRWRRKEEDMRGVCLEAVKNWGKGESKMGI